MKTLNDIMNDPEIAPLVKSYADSRVTSAIKTFSEKRPDTSALAARLARIEEASKEQEKKYELKFHVFKKCFENNVDYSLIENEQFADESAAEKRINALSSFAQKRQAEDINTRMTTESFHPKSGFVSEKPKEKSFDDYVQEIESGTLKL